MAPANGPSSIAPALFDSALRQLVEFADSHAEWFMTEGGRVPLEINRGDFDFSPAHGRLIFSSWTQQGSRSWRINEWRHSDDKLILRASRRMGAETTTIELVPRASARALVVTIAAARQERCERLAQLMAEGLGDRVLGVEHQHSLSSNEFENTDDESNKETLGKATFIDIDNENSRKASRTKQLHPTPYPQHPSVKIERAALSAGMRRDQPGRYARVILRSPYERVAATAIVAQSDPRNVDSLFSSALLWFARLQSIPRRPPINRLLLVVEHNILEAARQRHVLLHDALRACVALWQVDDDWSSVQSTPAWERRYLWRKKLPRFPPVIDTSATERVNDLVGLAPAAIDVVASRHGHTLRYHGLPFARVRRVMERDHVWFGVEGSPRRLWAAHQHREFAKLLNDLQTYRSEKCRDRRHWYYRSAGEAWLESILRRDITKLDPGLIIAPLHAQFRTSPGGAIGKSGPRPIDLLALRHDGRLVVIELKVNEDREHVFQGVDYWRRVEAHRRRGHISAAKLFGDREISDESPLVYLVAPTLRFHPSFATLGRTIAPDIEIYRFDISEDWRAGVRVVRRERVNT
ncbi:MAG TPA: hypothetical protein VHQ64_01315 [Pyrinomonadaceae bacterium]|jgi:hypothetical protein|nr:hypothetical protein [Pyrinomonadaceae bacterium]